MIRILLLLLSSTPQALLFDVGIRPSIRLTGGGPLTARKWDNLEVDAPIPDHDENFDYTTGLVPSGGEGYRCGYISIVGAPNMGKSTILNSLILEKLCVENRRPQTTRHAILGILTTDKCQLCLTDTPGVIGDPAYKLQEGMMEAVKGAFREAEALLVVTDLFSTPIDDDRLWKQVQQYNKPMIVAINKIDLVDKVNPNVEENKIEGRTVTVEEAVAKWRRLLPQALAIIPMSAGNGSNDVGVVALRKILLGGPDVPAAIRDLGRPIPGMFKPGVKTITDEEAKELLPLSPPMYEDDDLTDRNDRFFCSEIIRSSLLELMKKEIPYCCEVRIDSYREPRPRDAKKLVRMAATILVDRESQKPIVIGRGGQMIKAVGIHARKKLEEFLKNQVSFVPFW
eukprot:CAMPEP_0116835610 /NCGR_PEP_ID=MMETSP0418-20121206/7638_1 /TAXON_ID=1158023 /ORGANISM="Astrosyne radiata, Strain 13vi08-1A" /LENGTH=396 /DNA_ID=CAMNT_0004465291 /DNA_START=44 /DNA_END=1231 /DNA_ORIENTATION=-